MRPSVRWVHECAADEGPVTAVSARNGCKEFGLDYVKVLNTNKFNFKKVRPISNNTISISTAASILSYSRIYMAKTILSILNQGGRIYYTDTDSIATNIPLEKIESNLVGKGIGQFKLEHKVKEAYFISNKTYCLVLYDDTTIIKAKGVLNNSLTLEDFKSMYWNNKNVSAIKKETIKNLSEGSVTIQEKKKSYIKLSFFILSIPTFSICCDRSKPTICASVPL